MIASPHQFHRRLVSWYRRARRDLPWRVTTGSPAGALPDAYKVLVSEAMLQQTQVATVIPYFQRFIAQLPSIHDLANCPEQHVLKLWQGLGYYSRARNLRRCARVVVDKFDGKIPDKVIALLSLPGVGRYTAGAVASLAFGRRAAIVDGNVTRVLCRLDGIEADPRERLVNEKLWQRATELLPKKNVADYNSALMELGATVCTPRQPKCLICPVRDHCAALAAGKVDQIPPAKKTKPTKLNRRLVMCIVRKTRRGIETLLEQRPGTGRWAGMWQFITREIETSPKVNGQLERLDFQKSIDSLTVEVAPPIDHLLDLQHQLTHRRYEFSVYVAQLNREGNLRDKLPPNQRWVQLNSLSDYPLPRPHVMIATRLAEHLSQLPRLADAPRKS